jgi:hypothetical protein
MVDASAPDSKNARPQDVKAALEACARHGRNALSEALLAARALLDAISLGMTGAPASHAQHPDEASDLRRGLAGIAEAIDLVAASIAGGPADAGLPLADVIGAALDQEIRRWEDRSRIDPEARAVLRAFLGLREVLWELGLRPTEAASPTTRHGPTSAAKTRPARPQRVRRIVVE